MSFQKFWERLQLRNAALSDESAKLTLTVAELRRFIAKGYDAGFSDHKKLLADAKTLLPKSPFKDLFGF